jgi:hypothetical protein
MNLKPRLFIGSASESLDVAHQLENELLNDAETEVWNYNTFRPSHFTLEELIRKTRAVNFAAFILGQEDKTNSKGEESNSPRDNVVYEAGLFAGQLGISNVFLIIDKRGTKRPTDWEGLGYLVYDPEAQNQQDIIHKAAVKIRNQIADWNSRKKASIEQVISGQWWQYVLNIEEGSVVSLLDIFQSDDIAHWQINGKAWTKDGKSIAIFWSRAVALDIKDRKLFYYWEGKHPFDKSIPAFFGVGEIEFAKQKIGNILKADGWYSETPLINLNETVRKSTKYVRAGEEEVRVTEGNDEDAMRRLINTRIEEWKKLKPD